MNKYVKEFCKRGAMFAWGGPAIIAIIYACLKGAGTLTMLSVNEVVLGILSSIVLAFVAAGISIVYQIETLPKTMAGLIQMAVLYVDYLGIYLLNGWIPVDKVWIFTVIFVAGFAVIWLAVYLSTKRRVDKMNRLIAGAANGKKDNEL